jgi:hypothetical protein
MAKIIDGKAISAQIRAEIKQKSEEFEKKNGIRPGLAVIIVGDDAASQVYVRNKRRACEEIGYYSEAYELPETTTQDELNALVDKLNADDKIHGILCQLPLPKHLNENEVILRIDPKKDVDAFHPYNVGKIMIGDYAYLPCTPAGVMVLLERSGIEIAGIKPFSWLTWRAPVPQIPYLEKGGVLKRGQVGLLEGNGAEAVVPLEDNPKWIAEVAKYMRKEMDGFSGGGTIININVDGANVQNDAELADMIARRLQVMMERRGAVFA